tara:strand:- start:204 stop:539 length:336 start_codon:yes stop_codon:yes gene_type:complete
MTNKNKQTRKQSRKSPPPPPVREQPFFVVEDGSWDAMRIRLLNGERWVKSFDGRCPHQSKGKVECEKVCNCPFHMNFWDDDMMWRMDHGKKKPVMSVELFHKAMTGTLGQN